MTDLYKPEGAISLDTPGYNFQLRIGLQGYPKTGKTWAATTFPNPVFISFDRGLVSHIGRSDIIEIPFYDLTYVSSLRRKGMANLVLDRKEALIVFLEQEGPKFSSSQTLVLDASTGIQSCYHQWWENNKLEYATTGGQIDARKEWRLKLNYFTEIVMLLKSFKCNVIYITHEAPDEDDKGNLTGFVRPLLSGQFRNELQSHFTDWFRCDAKVNPGNDPERIKKMAEHLSISVADATNLVKESTGDSLYLWQTKPDNIAKCGTSLINAPKYILADYKSFTKYSRKPELIK